jgi:hypothetical protein
MVTGLPTPMKRLPSAIPIVDPTPQYLRDLVIPIAVEDPTTELSERGRFPCINRTQLGLPLLATFFLF